VIRPSLADRAELCGHVVELAERHPESNPAVERGNAVDREFSAAVKRGEVPADPDAQAAVEWIRSEFGADRTIWVQEKVALFDPASGELLTEGTPDVQVLQEGPGGAGLTTVDLKKREQYVAGLLRDPDDGLQCHGYSVARGLTTGAQRYRNVLLLFGDGEVEAVSSRWYPRDEWGAVIDRYRVLATKDRTPSPGAHCAGCYSRWYCEAYRARAALAATLLPETTDVAHLTDEQAGELVLRASLVEEAAKLAKKIAKAHVANGGQVLAGGKRWLPVVVTGHKTGDVKALEAAGLGQYVRQGAPFEQWRWRRA
jgi:hypothetical protein